MTLDCVAIFKQIETLNREAAFTNADRTLAKVLICKETSETSTQASFRESDRRHSCYATHSCRLVYRNVTAAVATLVRLKMPPTQRRAVTLAALSNPSGFVL